MLGIVEHGLNMYASVKTFKLSLWYWHKDPKIWEARRHVVIIRYFREVINVRQEDPCQLKLTWDILNKFKKQNRMYLRWL